MEIVILFNGLGNQMSQYAFYLSKKRQTGKCGLLVEGEISRQHNGFELERIFHIGYSENCLKILLRLIFIKVQFGTRLGQLLMKMGVNIVREPQNYKYVSTYLNSGLSRINFYKGGWHCEKYFLKIREELLKTFTFDQTRMNSETLKLCKMIKSSHCSVSIHVRRGDYLKKPWGIYDFSEVATESYYKDAISYLKNLLGNSITFFVFSDDISWCRDRFIGDNYVYVDHNKGLDSWQDMFLISCCCWHINANSTFSWWGAWLSATPNNTIVPNKFLRFVDTPDIYPESWIRI